jgi:hypothetical protein
MNAYWQFHKLQNAIDYDIDSKNPYIISHEYEKSNGKSGRYFYLLPSFNFFKKYRKLFPHAHEILATHSKLPERKDGRLVFDFDIKNEYRHVKNRFVDIMEKIIWEVIEENYCDLDLEKIKFVWSTSNNPNKFSKHLTIKNFCFTNWINGAKLFYYLLREKWNDLKYDKWISIDEVIDFQIIRKTGSLRMTGSSKITGCLLTIDDPEFTLHDSLIRPMIDINKEQYVSKLNIVASLRHRYQISEKKLQKNLSKNTSSKIIQEELRYPLKYYYQAFEEIDKLQPDVFSIRKFIGNRVELRRLKSSTCLLSKRLHESDNAYIIIYLDYFFRINYRFGCYRNCGKRLNLLQ